MVKNINASAVKLLHTQLATKFSKILGYECTIEQTLDYEDAWDKAAIGRSVFFQLQSRSHREYYIEHYNLLPLKTLKQHNLIWHITWYEQWRSLGRKKFDLLGCGLGAYLAEKDLEHATKVVRCEYAQEGGTNYAQPHWHFDPRIIHRNKNELFFGVERVHFGAAGWWHDQQNCWKTSLSEEQLLSWSTRVL